jgi:hypothetical protein
MKAGGIAATGAEAVTAQEHRELELALDFAADAWARGHTCGEPPPDIEAPEARNRWRWQSGAIKSCYTRLYQLTGQRPTAQDELVVVVQNAAIVAAEHYVFGPMEPAEAFELGKEIVAEAVHQVERDANRYERPRSSEPRTDHDTGTSEPPPEAEQRPPRFIFVDDAELEARPAPAWLVEDVLVEQSVAQIVGAPGSYKSFLALDLAAHVRTAANIGSHRPAGLSSPETTYEALSQLLPWQCHVSAVALPATATTL